MTERKRAEEAMRRNEERFRVALKDSPITVFNQDSRPCAIRGSTIPTSTGSTMPSARPMRKLLARRRLRHLTALKKPSSEDRCRGCGKKSRFPITAASYVVRYDDRAAVRCRGDVSLELQASCMDIARLRETADRLQDAKDKLAQEKSYLENEIQTELGFEEIIGHSSALRDVLKKARIVAPTDSTVLLLGETGTGKELVASSVHALSATARQDVYQVELRRSSFRLVGERALRP